MKLNFGHGILMIILLFMTGILILVYKCSKQQVDPVSSSYYEQELKYSEQIIKRENSLQLIDDLKIGYDQNNHVVIFNFPAVADLRNLTGNINFYKPDNATLDFSKSIDADGQFKQAVETSGMAHGYWNVKVNWSSGSTPYYSETKIFIN